MAKMKTKLIWTASAAVLFAATALVSTAAAQDDDSSQQPHWRPRATARHYPDDEREVRPTSATEDAPLSLPVPVTIDSPSNQPTRRTRPRPSADMADASSAPTTETVPAPHGSRTHGAPSPRYDDGYDNPRPAMQQNQVFGDDGDASFGSAANRCCGGPKADKRRRC
jgi:hypothetical protein